MIETTQNNREEMNIDYDHKSNIHTERGADAALPYILSARKIRSLLDVGCGLGVWLKAALDLGIQDVFGVDGVEIPPEQMLISSERFQQLDLTLPVNLGRQFDMVLCLEVAEHLDECFAPTLVKTLTDHSNIVVFSAAPPHQPGQHHVNCQHPVYWQELFNRVGFACSEEIRWRMWTNSAIEPWYRQNIFIAQRESSSAGKESRIKSVIHPELMPFIFSTLSETITTTAYSERVTQIENGAMPIEWYFRKPLKGLYKKLQRHGISSAKSNS